MICEVFILAPSSLFNDAEIMPDATASGEQLAPSIITTGAARSLAASDERRIQELDGQSRPERVRRDRAVRESPGGGTMV